MSISIRVAVTIEKMAAGDTDATEAIKTELTRDVHGEPRKTEGNTMRLSAIFVGLMLLLVGCSKSSSEYTEYADEAHAYTAQMREIPPVSDLKQAYEKLNDAYLRLPETDDEELKESVEGIRNLAQTSLTALSEIRMTDDPGIVLILKFRAVADEIDEYADKID